MAYTNVSERYKEVIYSGDAKTRAILKINNKVVVDLDTLPENNKISKITKIHNILKTGNNRFSLDNFTAQEVEIKISDFDYSLYENTNLGENEYNVIDLKLATLVDNVWVEVPIGIFNIVGTPTTDKKITTIKANCNRIKFDINYNAQPLIEENNGEVEIGVLLQDICNTCGVELGTTLPFINSDTKIGVYDNTIKACIYVSYICEKAGSIAVCGRDGKLYLIKINNQLYKHTLDSFLIKGQNTLNYGDKFIYDRIVFEDGLRKFANPVDETKNTTIYINAQNPYILSQEEIDNVYNSINGFSIENLKFEIIGNPCIDSWDLIEFEKEGITHKTLANNTLIFTGVLSQKFETSIGTKETVKENITLKNQNVAIKKISIEQDQQKGTISAVVNEQSNQSAKLSQLEISNGMITEQVSSMQTTIDETTNAVVEIENKVTQTITDSNAQFEIINSTLENGVEKLKNSLVSIDINGISVQYNEENFKALMTNKNFVVNDGTNEIAFFGYDENLQKTIARIKELETERITAGYHRCEGFTDGLEKRTGWFYVGGVD